MKLIAQADVVIALGSRMGPFGTLPQHGMDYWPKDAKIIQVEADHTNLGLVKKITVGIHGDAKAVAKELLRRLSSMTLASDATKAQRATTIATEKAAWEKELDGWTHERDAYSLDMIDEAKSERTPTGGTYLHPRQVLRELEKAMPKRVMVSTDIGNINAVANSYLRFDEPRSFFAPMSFGNCGYSLPTMIGAKAAAMPRSLSLKKIPAMPFSGSPPAGVRQAASPAPPSRKTAKKSSSVRHSTTRFPSGNKKGISKNSSASRCSSLWG
jgi:sulfoacetaldehyde acetyltransferase